MRVIETKVWGTVEHIFDSHICGVSRLWVNQGFQCSKHYHEDRHNFFFVLTGRIDIELFDDDDMIEQKGELSDIIPLVAGRSLMVQAGIVHRFKVITSGEIIEVYLPKNKNVSVKKDDIVRLQIGGPI